MSWTVRHLIHPSEATLVLPHDLGLPSQGEDLAILLEPVGCCVLQLGEVHVNAKLSALATIERTLVPITPQQCSKRKHLRCG